jgi:hypothetical protein
MFIGTADLDLRGNHALTVFRRHDDWREIARFDDTGIYNPVMHVAGESVAAISRRDPPTGKPQTLRVVRRSAVGFAEEANLPQRPEVWSAVHGKSEILHLERDGRMLVMTRDGIARHLPHIPHFAGAISANLSRCAIRVYEVGSPG